MSVRTLHRSFVVVLREENPGKGRQHKKADKERFKRKLGVRLSAPISARSLPTIVSALMEKRRTSP
jgi:hypothetical protein